MGVSFRMILCWSYGPRFIRSADGGGGLLRSIKQMRTDGDGIIGLKILGQGDMRDRPAEAIRYALGTGANIRRINRRSSLPRLLPLSSKDD
jgi:hypothetical protein